MEDSVGQPIRIGDTVIHCSARGSDIWYHKMIVVSFHPDSKRSIGLHDPNYYNEKYVTRVTNKHIIKIPNDVF